MLQVTGAHVHADEAGHIGAPEVSYQHTHAHDRAVNAHDHDGANGQAGSEHDDVRDVSLLDAVSSAFKLPLALIAVLLIAAIEPVLRSFFSTPYVYPVLSGRYTRWRPPLRAPPATA